MTRKYCHNKGDVPTGLHWAIVEFSSIHIEGDERSRTNPGHGYGAHSEDKATYISFTNREEWSINVSERSQRQYDNNFVAFEVAGLAKIAITVKVEV